MSRPSLEAERQNILHRMQMRREGYRRMLVNGGDLSSISDVEPLSENAVGNPHTGHGSNVGAHAGWPTARRAVATYRPAAAHNSRGPLMRVLTEHPLLCALGVAAVVAIGPKRIARTVMSGGAAAGTMMTNNPSNIDLLGRILTMAGAYVQGRTTDKH
jgi:hypothetical protein